MILIELSLDLLSGDHTFAYSFNEVVSLGIVIVRSWWKVGCPQGADQLGVDLCRGHGFHYFETNGRGQGSGHASSHLAWGHISLCRIYSGHDVLDFQCEHEFSNSNAWTTLIDVPPKEYRWPLCTGWALGWCNMLPMPVSMQSYGCSSVDVDRCLTLCHTQCNLGQLGANIGPVQIW